MARIRSYEVTKEMIADLKDAYDALFVAEDINAKFREAGEPRPEAEAKLREARERLERHARAFEVTLD